MKSHTYSPGPKTIVLLLALLTAGAFLPYRLLRHAAASGPQQLKPAAHWSEQPQILAKQRGNPWINVEDGHEVLTTFAGASELKAGMESNQTHPLSLTTADFDEDGTPDIVAGYVSGQRGSASFMRGNVDAIFPNSAEAKGRKERSEFTDTPFLGLARLFELPVVPEFLAAGDFNADGHWDIVAAARTDGGLYFMLGDGRGGFGSAQRVELPGPVTALLAADFNRRDGLTDLIVAVQGEQSAQLMVFENPYGAMKAQPEVFNFAAPITSLAIGSIEGDARPDLAIAAGNELTILRGRDRNLLLDESGKSAEAVELSRRQFAFEIDAVAIGDFLKSETAQQEIALLSTDGRIHLLENGGTTDARGNLYTVWRAKETISLPNNPSNATKGSVLLTARVSARSVDTLVVGLGEQIHLLTSDIVPPKSDTEPINYEAQKFSLAASLDVTGTAVAILPMRLNVDALSDLVVMRANSIAPAIVPSAPMSTFIVTSTANVADGNLGDPACSTPPCNPSGLCSGECTYFAARQQANATAGASVINFAVPGASTPTFLTPQIGISNPLTIDGMTQPGGFVQFTGTSSFPAFHFTGLNTDSCVFRGMVANGINGGNFYINFQSSNNIAEGNRIGTTVDGTALVAGTSNGGVSLSFGNNLVGGTTPAARNIISTGTAQGVSVGGNAGAGTPNRVQGNFIGTDITGTVALGNNPNGVLINGPNILLGGTAAGAGNVVSATTGTGFPNGCGVIGGGAGTGVLIQGNRIGTNVTGTAALPNSRFGIAALTGNRSFDAIGGTSSAARNLISGNGSDGLNISSTGSAVQPIQGNFIGTDQSGSAAIPNVGFGLAINGSGTKLIDNNVISGNTGGGLNLCCNSPGGSDVVSNNKIGTDATGSSPLGNTGVGLQLGGGGALRNGTITGNVISANGSHGILLDGGSSLVFQSNFIGTNSSGSTPLGNGGDGIRFTSQVDSNTIGGLGVGNTIAFNHGTGVNLATVIAPNGHGNLISHNSIFSNDGLGIDLGGNGVTANDACDSDNGANLTQNFPVITSVTPGATDTTIVGTLNSTANTLFTIEFFSNDACDPSGNGEGKVSLGTKGSVPTNASCSGSFSFTVPNTAVVGSYITATATDSNNNTSEFSACTQIPPPLFQFSAASYNVGEGDGSITVTVNRTLNTSPISTVDFSTGNNEYRPCSPGDPNNIAGLASQNCDFIRTQGTLTFNPGETSKTFTVLVSDDAFAEGLETLPVTLSNPVGGTLGAISSATVTITDNDTALATSPAPFRFAGALSKDQETPPTNSIGFGQGLVLLSQNQTSAQAGLLWSNLTSSQTVQHIHDGAPGVAGPIIFTLPNGSPVINTQLNGITAQQVADLKAGLLYMNTHTTNFPNGEIRAQLLWNPTLEESFFVNQHYFDFLQRAPDAGGLAFWMNSISSCVADVQCFYDRTIGVSNAFFYEQEYQQTGAYVYRLFRASFGNTQPAPNPDGTNPTEAHKIPSYDAYSAARALVVGGANLTAGQQDAANLFVNSPQFLAKYPANLPLDQFVDAMLATITNDIGVNLTSQRTALIALGSRTAVLYRLANDDLPGGNGGINNRPFIDAEYNRGFVVTQYFGYLRRDGDIGGILFWLSQVSSAPLRDVTKQNAMVCSFITSGEYQLRFGPKTPRNNKECPQ